MLRRTATKRIWTSSDPVTCPVKAMQLYLRKTKAHQQDQPLFQVITNYKGKQKLLTWELINSVIKRESKAAGIRSNMSNHSCRVVGATVLAAAASTSEQIRLLGRWVSDCYQIYTRMVAPFAKAASDAFGNMATSTMSNQIETEVLRVVNNLRDNPIAAITMDKQGNQGDWE